MPAKMGEAKEEEVNPIVAEEVTECTIILNNYIDGRYQHAAQDVAIHHSKRTLLPMCNDSPMCRRESAV